MAAWWTSSDEDSSSEFSDYPTAKIKTEPGTCKTEPVSETESDDESDISDTSPFSTPPSSPPPLISLVSADFSSVRSDADRSHTLPCRERSPIISSRSHTLPFRERSPIRNDRHCTLPRLDRRPVRSERLGTLPPRGSPIASTSSHTGRYSPYSDIDYYNLNGFVPEATAMADGLNIQYERGFSVIPYTEVPHRVIFTGPTSIAVSLPGSHQEWIHIPGGVAVDENIIRMRSLTAIIPIDYLKNGILPPYPVVRDVPLESIIDGVPPNFRIDSCPPAIPIHGVPIDSVPLAVPFENFPIEIKSELISDDEDDADNHNMYTNVAADVHNDAAADVHNDAAADVYNQVHTDAYNDAYNEIDMEALEAKENLVLRSIESNEGPGVERSESYKELVVERSESNEEPVMERWSESNEESFEEKSIPLVMSSSEHFQKEICQKDSCDPMFGDGFEIYQIMNPKLRENDGTFLFEVQWRHDNFAGIDIVEAPIIYDHWPDVALKFFQERYPEDKNKKKEKTD